MGFVTGATNTTGNVMNSKKAVEILRSGLTTQQEQEEIADLLEESKNKDLIFSHWYDNLEGTKSQGFAYKAFCAGWNARIKDKT
jgi:hypothetical protein